MFFFLTINCVSLKKTGLLFFWVLCVLLYYGFLNLFLSLEFLQKNQIVNLEYIFLFYLFCFLGFLLFKFFIFLSGLKTGASFVILGFVCWLLLWELLYANLGLVMLLELLTHFSYVTYENLLIIFKLFSASYPNNMGYFFQMLPADLFGLNLDLRTLLSVSLHHPKAYLDIFWYFISALNYCNIFKNYCQGFFMFYDLVQKLETNSNIEHLPGLLTFIADLTIMAGKA